MKKLLLIACFFFSFAQMQAQKNIDCYIFIAEECPISIYMVKPLKKAMTAAGDDVTFHAVFPKSNSTEETAQRFLETYELTDVKILLDVEQEFSKKMGATITPEAIVLDDEGELLYRGRISDAYAAPGRMKHGPRNNDLIDVLALIQKGEQIKNTSWQPAIGCFITFH